MSKAFKYLTFPHPSHDRDKWDAFIDKIKISAIAAIFQDGKDSPAQWDSMSHKDKENLLRDIAQWHQEVFGYEGTTIDLCADYDLPSASGYWGVISWHPHSKEFREMEDGIAIPDVSAPVVLQLLIHSLAKNLLYQRTAENLATIENDLQYGQHVSDILKIGTHALRFKENEQCDIEVMLNLPMPGEFEAWMTSPSNRYAWGAASYACEELIGHGVLDQEIYARKYDDFMGHQYDTLTNAITFDNRLMYAPDSASCEIWTERAKKYVTKTLRDNRNADHSREAARLVGVMHASSISVTLPKDVRSYINNTPSLLVMTATEESRARRFIFKHSIEDLKDLRGKEKANLIYALGPQEKVNPQLHKICNEAAQKVLLASGISPEFMNYYAALFEEMGEAFRRHQELQDLAGQWTEKAALADKMAFLYKLNEEASKHLRIEPVPICLYDEKPEIKGRYSRGTLGFSSPYAEYHLKGLDLSGFAEQKVPKSGPVIGLNLYKEFGLFSAPTPRAASSTLLHEITHQLDDSLVKKLDKGTLKESDPRHAHIGEIAVWKNHNANKRLRNEFSPGIYPLIVDEQFQYRASSMFARVKAFAFHRT